MCAWCVVFVIVFDYVSSVKENDNDSRACAVPVYHVHITYTIKSISSDFVYRQNNNNNNIRLENIVTHKDAASGNGHIKYIKSFVRTIIIINYYTLSPATVIIPHSQTIHNNIVSILSCAVTVQLAVLIDIFKVKLNLPTTYAPLKYEFVYHNVIIFLKSQVFNKCTLLNYFEAIF